MNKNHFSKNKKDKRESLSNLHFIKTYYKVSTNVDNNPGAAGWDQMLSNPLVFICMLFQIYVRKISNFYQHERR